MGKGRERGKRRGEERIQGGGKVQLGEKPPPVLDQLLYTLQYSA